MPNTKEVEQAAKEYAENKSSSEVFRQAHIADFIAGYNFALSNPLEQSEKKEEWVSVAERLPENEQWVLVAKKFKSGYDIMLMAHQFYTSFNGDKNCFIPYGEPIGYKDLSHLKPLPKPPKNLV